MTHDAAADVVILRRRSPEVLVCTRCAVLLATRRASYARSGLTEAQRLAFVCAECRLEEAAAARLRAVRRATITVATAAARQRRREAAESATKCPPAHRPRVASDGPLADPRPERESEAGNPLPRTPRVGARRGGRPRLGEAHARERNRERVRAYRQRRSATVPAPRPA